MLEKEFIEIIRPILEIDEFNDIKRRQHHGITRYDHSMNVAYITYVVCKNLNLNYKEATFAALLHDFFNKEVAMENGYKRLIDHPKIALKNACKYFDLSDLQKDIISKHMFPITLKSPKYKESLLVSLIDKYSSINERLYTTINEIKELPIIRDIIYQMR